MTVAMMHRSVAAIPGGDGWWASAGEIQFHELAEELRRHGFKPAEVVEFLEKAYAAVSGEFQ